MYLQETEKSFLGYRTLAKIVYKYATPPSLPRQTSMPR